MSKITPSLKFSMNTRNYRGETYFTASVVIPGFAGTLIVERESSSASEIPNTHYQSKTALITAIKSRANRLGVTPEIVCAKTGEACTGVTCTAKKPVRQKAKAVVSNTIVRS
jgi:hypothetical protein